MWEQMAVPKKIAALVCGYCLLAIRVEELLYKERLGYFLHGPARPRQNPGGFLQVSLETDSAIDIRLSPQHGSPRHFR